MKLLVVCVVFTALIYICGAHSCSNPEIVDIKRFNGKNKGYVLKGNKSSFTVSGCYGSLLRVDEVCLLVKCVSELNIEHASQRMPCFQGQGCVGSALGLDVVNPAEPLKKWQQVCFAPSIRILETFSVSVVAGGCKPKIRKMTITRCL